MFIDARDLANFIVRLIESRAMGIYNANGPADGPMTMGRLLDGCRTATDSDARFTWCDADWLAARGVMNWQHMPVWINPVPAMAGFHTRSLTKAIGAGLVTRPLRETVRDTLTWLDEEFIPAVTERGGSFEPGVGIPGITPAREAELLAEWRTRDTGEGG
jgi:2'-hydroxyisoflavone reductase